MTGMAQWDPATYLAFADERARPFVDLLSRVQVRDAQLVVDLGCGPGHLSRVLRDRWPSAHIHGVDASPEMITRAEADNSDADVTYECADAAHFRPAQQVDVLVSNAALQWMPDHRALIGRWVSLVRPGGAFAFQVPGNFGEPSHRLLHELAADPRFAPYTRAVEHPSADDAATYLALLSGHGLAVDAWETTYLHVLEGPDAVFDWIKGTGARPVLESLPDGPRAVFVDEYRRLLRRAYPRQPFGTLLPFRRVFVVVGR
jgi:trans-aconitate 2-methyltransferase